jgi:hypothetical protein
LGSPPVDSERFERFSSISETVSGFGGGAVSITGSGADAWEGAAACGFALLIGGTAERTALRGADGGLLVPVEIRSVAG